MSVKKMGKGLLLHDSWKSFNYKVTGIDGMFSSNQLVHTELPEIKAIGEKPEAPRYGRRSVGQHEEYDRKYNEYNAKVKELIPEIHNRLEQETSTNPISLHYRKDMFTGSCSNLIYCAYKGNIYKFDRVGYSEEEMVLQIMNLEDDERRKFERLKHKFSLAEKEEKSAKRPAVPENVRIAVWRRDEGKCVKCGSRERLEYDHIIPISKGGSNTVRNIELLCENCNRSKRDNIG